MSNDNESDAIFLDDFEGNINDIVGNKVVDAYLSINEKEVDDDMIDKVKVGAWKQVFKVTDIENICTKDVKHRLLNDIREISNLSFSKKNIKDIVFGVLMNKNNIVQETVEEAFDIMTKFHKENRVYHEGWKTNDQWKVNKKVILPDAVKNEYISVSIRDYVTDIDRAMYGLQGRTLEISNTIKSKVCSMHRNRTLSFNTWYDSEHFEFKLFKKGTLHLRFKDDELYKIFNQVACKGKSWLTT